ncbi:nicotinate-nucleotide--dimethylbenzimidazole phosphoribosyltransferase [Paenibacillus sp. 598K]|uniref:nicotinate-nucleotide--dimethylbenzimidazole phosphoribosyltransferase n=1 Tax=Paenibacillus sp. 598K TaxID=1117987 RepID=UPI000FF95C99|nr:nicotinate-nucleotide--dimethylbenzimidazole phosphoribosyltransferase [Paenibacillus sp. 598K]GBF78405.1 nicotinate-nucleotide--dimethylbenzimidazole phosphoribosyltransferase [Paenibacillus sp. 598K]
MKQSAEQQLTAVASAIGPLDESAMAQAAARLDSLTKPPGSLGALETLAVRLAGICGEVDPILRRKAIVVMAADHGVCEEGVSAYPAAVTPQMALNIAAGGAAVNVLARQAGAEVHCVDIGVAAELAHPAIWPRKIRPGTANMARGAAMTRDEASRAVLTGIEVADELASRGVELLGTGEMGIGNTTASAALCAVLCGLPLELATGLGTGITEEARQRKQAVIAQAIATNRPDPADPLDTLAKIGSLEIAALAGLILGGAARRLPIVIDGFISTAAALVALRLAAAVAPYVLPSHLSQERGHAGLLETLGLEPPLRLGMRLGEGTGAALAFHLVEAASRIIREMATFEDAGVSRS